MCNHFKFSSLFFNAVGRWQWTGGPKLVMDSLESRSLVHSFQILQLVLQCCGAVANGLVSILVMECLHWCNVQSFQILQLVFQCCGAVAMDWWAKTGDGVPGESLIGALISNSPTRSSMLWGGGK